MHGWRTLWITSLVLAMMAVSAGCRSANDIPRPGAADSTRTVFLVEHGWHAGIMFRRADVAPGAWRVLEDFPDARYVEVGWGDADYYQAANPGAGTLLKAGLWPTSSVLHVATFRRPPTEVFRGRTIIRIPVSEAGFDALLSFIRNEHARGPDGQPVTLGPGWYGESRFYKATTRYHALNNCNTWAARALRVVGCSMAPARALTVRSLLAQARDCGAEAQARR
jgi:uncharacterized protein (TIGR02117 family)